jgi:hypothetical protein
MSALMTVKEWHEYCANLWAECAWNANHYCYELFIDQQMNEGIDPIDGTMYRAEVRI